MFPYENFEVYKKAYLANRIIYQLLKTKISLDFYLKNQFGKASLSMMLNLAEGSAKVGTRDRRNFFVIACGSMFECASLINFLYDECEITQTERNELYLLLEEISEMLYTMINRLA